MTKFITHSLNGALKKKYGARLVPANGAAESVKQLIRQRLNVHYAH